MIRQDNIYTLDDCLELIKKGKKFLKVGKYELSVEKYLRAFQANYNIFNSYDCFDRAIDNVYSLDHNCLDWKNIVNKANIKNPKILELLNKITQIGFLGKRGSTVDPLGQIFVNHNLKLVYCSIPKNACTFFKQILVEYSDLKNEYQEKNQSVHNFLGDKRQERKIEELITSIEDKNYTKIIILRNPLTRLVSAYLNKVITFNRLTPYVKKMVDDVYKHSQINDRDYKDKITFEQFVEYLCRTEDYELNVHFKPQHCFMGNIQYDLVGQFENMDSILDLLQSKFGIITERTKTQNQITYQESNHHTERLFHKMYRQELCSLNGLPKPEQLYTPKLESMIRERYAQDIEIYENYFRIKIDSYYK